MKRLFSTTLTLAFALASATPCWAADPEREARERYDNAVKLYEEGAYDAALVELNRAAELKPSYKLYYNIAQVRFAMHDYAAAIEAYRQYLDKGGEKLAPARREQVQKELTNLAQRVAKLSIEVDVPGAEIFVDDAPIGTSPLAGPVVVNSGNRRVIVRHPDYLPQSKRVTLAGNVQDKVSFALLGRTAPTEPPASAPDGSTPGTPGPTTTTPASPAATDTALAPSGTAPAGAERSRGSNKVWIGWALTGAFAAGAVATGIVTLSKNSSLDSDRKRLDVPDDEIDSRASKVRTFAVITDGLAAAALVAGGVSLWLTLSDGSGDKAEPAAARAKPKWRLGIAPQGIQLKTTF